MKETDHLNLLTDPSLSPGRWIVALSGGGDSVALLHLLRQHRPDILPVIFHLNHNLRGQDSDADQAFVEYLSTRLSLPIHTMRLRPTSAKEADLRQQRYQLMTMLAKQQEAAGILTAHHADDRAEGALLRVAQRSQPWAIDALHARRTYDGVVIARPLLHLRKQNLLRYLNSTGTPFRTDRSNALLASRRNVIRQLIAKTPGLFEQAIALADLSLALRHHLAALPALDERPSIHAIADSSQTQANFLLRRWVFRNTGIRPSTRFITKLINRCRDAALSSTVTLAPGIRIKRQRGTLIVVA